MKYTDLLAKFSNAVDEADGVVVPCPAHADSNPSMKITVKDSGQALVVCRAGCPQPKVMAALRAMGITAADLFNIDGQGARTISAKAPETVGPGEIAGLKMFVDETSAALPGSAEAAAYLADRFGLTVDQAEDLGVGYAAPGDRPQAWLSRGFTRHPRITVPLYGFDGVARGLQGRDIGGKCPARWVSLTNPDGRTWAKWGLLTAGTGYDVVLVTEGPGDGLTSVGVGYDALLIRGAGIARNAALVAELVAHLRGRDVVLAFDPDDSGARGISLLAKALDDDGNTPRQLQFPNAKEDLTAWRERTPETFATELHAAVRSAPVVDLTPEPAPEPPKKEVDIPATDAALDTMSESARSLFDNTDVGIAVRLRDFMARTGGGVRYAAGLGFLTWDGMIWTPGEAKVRESLHIMGAELIASGEDADRRLAIKALTNRSIDAVMKELPSVPGVPASAADFDAHHELLSVENGTVDLRTGELRPHRPEDMITKRLDLAYNPEAKADRWEQFLTEIFPNHPELPAYMRRLVGYGITGSTSEECFAFLHGDGKNGKSKFLGALIDTFRGVTKSTEFSTFESRVSVGQASPEVAALRGARLVTASETEKYSRLAEGLIKQLTGGDPVTCRQLYGAPFTYVPSFLLLVAGNYKPAILSQDYGIWRRVKLVPFEASFHGAKADLRLAERLREERAGILSWAVRGAREWYTQGLGEPDSVASATQDYRESEDRLEEFLKACCVREQGARVAPMAIRRTYKEWAEDAGLDRKEILSGWALAVELESRHFKKDKRKGSWGFNGLRLMTDEERSIASRLAEDVHETTADTGPTDIFNQPKEAA
ncbi:phage/plasmid primase, P4 family [Streptomyces halstedii]|uniref:phage/plasmid primase, P4 family n=1 Tax=Streptomyces halstedii TaxID=1944 RepID=UPI00380BDBC0